MYRSAARSLLRRNFNSAGIRQFSLSRIQRQEYRDATPEVFEQVVAQGGSKPVIVDFYATWCQPCTMLSPVLEKYVNDPNHREGDVDLVTVNIDEQGDLAAKYKVTALPTVIAFKNGQKVNSFIGLLSVGAIRKFIRDLL